MPGMLIFLDQPQISLDNWNSCDASWVSFIPSGLKTVRAVAKMGRLPKVAVTGERSRIVTPEVSWCQR